MGTATISTPEPLQAGAGVRLAASLAVMLAAVFMAAADVAIVNVAAPSVRADLRASGTMIVLAVSGYTLAYATLLVVGARLGHAFGQRRIFALGVAGFSLASLACGLAPDAGVLLATRLVQGASAALMVPQVLAIIQLRLEGEQRARALSAYATVISLGVVVGLVLGGALVSLDLLGSGWRPVFLVNVPIGATMLVLIPRTLPATSGGVRRPLDLPGMLLIGTSVVLLLLPAAMGQQEGWPAWTFASLAVGTALVLVTGVVLARRAPGAGIVDVGIFRAPGVAAGYGSIFASTAAYGAFLFTLVLLLQSAAGYEAWACGLAIAPYAAGFALTSLNHGRLPRRVRGRAPVAGLMLLALGYLVVGALAGGGHWHVSTASLALALAGAGYGCGFSPVMAATLARVPRANAADASGSLSMTLQFGYVAGVTVLGSLFLSHAHLPDEARGGRAFLAVSAGLGALAALAGWLAARATRERSAA